METIYLSNTNNKEKNISAINKYSINLLKDKILKYSKEDKEVDIKSKWFNKK